MADSRPERAAAASPGSVRKAGDPERPDRRGRPSPLIFHLAAAAQTYQAAIAAAPGAAGDGFPWHPALGEKPGTSPAVTAVAAESVHRLRAMLDGIERWQDHPYRRASTPATVVWQLGSTRLYDYGGTGRPVLAVPSLINRAYILDLHDQQSALQGLRRRGLRPFLLDWGPPGEEEESFDIEDYAVQRLLPALAVAEALGGGRVALFGYCMGGTLAAGIAARMPGRIARLTTVGAPWDFAADCDSLSGRLRALYSASGGRSVGAGRVRLALSAMGGAFGVVPADVFQYLFAAISPTQALTKFRRFAAMDPDSAAARHFVALEDWLADGVAMAVPAAQELLAGWQIENRPASRGWRLLGAPVDPRAIACPALIVTGRADSIAPPASAAPLAHAIRGARRLAPGLGHVGMIAGHNAATAVLDPVAAFLAAAD